MNKEGKKEQEKQDKVKPKNSFKKELLSYLLYIGAALIITFFTVRFVGQRTRVKGSSMETVLSNKDNLVVDKISYVFTDPKRFDIIVFPQGQDYYIKRIMGLPGETIQVIEGYLYVNGSLLDEDYGNEVMKMADLAKEEIVLGEEEYFVLGDNRNNSTDSRRIGPIHKEKILGKAWVRIWPLNKIGFIKH
jgi:signal peptidase I, bacterial type